jgi:hypothetical protein
VSGGLKNQLPDLQKEGIRLDYEIWKIPHDQRKKLSEENAWGLTQLETSPERLQVEFINLLHPWNGQPSVRKVFVDVENEKVPGPSLLTLVTLFDRTPQDVRLISHLHRFYANKDLKTRLKSVYGPLQLNAALRVAEDGMATAYKAVNILGFSISARLFPWAVLIFGLAGLVGTWFTARTASSLGVSRLDEEVCEDATWMLIRNPVARFIVWVPLPVVAIWASLPAFPLSLLEKTGLIAGSAFLGVLGGLSYIAKCFRKSTD